MILHRMGHEAVAVGVGTSPSALKAVGDWADTVFVMSEMYRAHLDQSLLGKAYTLEVGRDIWSNPYHKDLHRVVEGLLGRWFETHHPEP